MAGLSFWASELKDARKTVAAFLKGLLAQGVFDAIYVPLRTPQGDSVVPALVHDPDLLEQADPLAPVMLINGARAVAALTVSATAGRIAAVLRPCEIRALIELCKLRQASLDRLTIIGLDCAGTYEVTDYIRLSAGGADAATPLVVEAAEGAIHQHNNHTLRPACQMCDYPVPLNAQITIGFIGVDGLMIEMDEATAGKLGLRNVAPHPSLDASGDLTLRALPDGERGQGASCTWPVIPPGDLMFRQDIVQRLVSERTAQREEAMTALTARLASPAALGSYFAACQRCHNCMVACPICYCKECLFRTAALDHEPERYLRLAERKGATRLPADTVLFHLTRLNHMSTSCVGCGLCESACPSDIPLTVLFRSVAARTQALFDYVPGRRLDEDVPLMTFREAELEGV